MRFLDYLQEEYIGMFKGNHFRPVSTTIFCNPSNKELQELDDVRFILDKKKEKIYVWDSELVHYEAAIQLKKLGLISVSKMDSTKFWQLYYAGVGHVQGNKIRWRADSDYRIEFSSDFIFKEFESIPDLEWTDKWIIWNG